MTVRVGIIGMGFMGRTHARACAALDPLCRLIAVCTRSHDPYAPRPGNLPDADAGPPYDPSRVARCADPRELLHRPDVDLVSICTPTDTHAPLARAALQAGKHVLVEKPVSLDPGDIADLISLARRHNLLCMPAMCVRYWPAWSWLRDRIADASLGRLRSLLCTRVGAHPTWSDFYRDESRSGSALFDLHIHDADFIYWALGPPRAVTASGSPRHLCTLYHYDAPAPVLAEGGWLDAPYPFTMRFRAEFDRAAADFDLTRDPPLLLHLPDRPAPVDLPDESAYVAQLRDAVSAVAAGSTSTRATLDDALAVTRLLYAERLSLSTRSTVPFDPPP